MIFAEVNHSGFNELNYGSTKRNLMEENYKEKNYNLWWVGNCAMFIPTALDAIRTTTGELISHQYVFSRRMRMGEVVVSSVKHFKLHCMVIMNCMFSYIMHMYRYCARYQFI